MMKNLLLQEILKADLRVFKLEELKSLSLVKKHNSSSLNKILRSLVQNGWLFLIKQGVYTLSSIVSRSPIHEFSIAMKNKIVARVKNFKKQLIIFLV